MSVELIRRWDEDPSPFWGALIRIQAEFQYDPVRRPSRLPHPHGPIRPTAVGVRFPEELKAHLRRVAQQLPELLPALEELLQRSFLDGIERIHRYQDLFQKAYDRIDLAEFADEITDPSIEKTRADLIARVLFLKSELLLVIAQFELLQHTYHKRRLAPMPSPLKAVA